MAYLEKIEGNRVDLRISYLENLILEKKSSDRDVHNSLVTFYLQAYSESKATGDSRKRLVIKEKLLKFLNTSNLYNSERLLSKFSSDEYEDLYEEMALLLSKIGMHDQALSIYVHKMERPDLADKLVFMKITIIIVVVVVVVVIIICSNP